MQQGKDETMYFYKPNHGTALVPELRHRGIRGVQLSQLSKRLKTSVAKICLKQSFGDFSGIACISEVTGVFPAIPSHCPLTFIEVF